MRVEGYKQGEHRHSQLSLGANQRYAWKERTYVVPTPSRKGFQWKASALSSLQRLDRRSQAGQPVTIVVPALYHCMPAEVLALGWLNEIDALATIRHRIMLAAKLIGWDAFTFHTRHNLDPYFDSAIKAVRETWLHEGALIEDAIAQTKKRFGAAYDYHRIEPRLVENLLIQSSLMDWLTARAAERPLRFHVIGTALLSGLVWSGALTTQSAIRTAVKVGMRWDGSLETLAEDDLRRSGVTRSVENLGWRRFHRVRQVVEGRTKLSLAAAPEDLPRVVEAPARPFWYSATAKEEPARIETLQDVRAALQTMNLLSWSPDVPKPLVHDRITGRVRGWLVSPMHPVASACHWSVYNYLLATPAASLLFLDHIAAMGPVPPLPNSPNVFRNRSAATYPSARP